ncbi:MetQ/NlpA family ABC transporter substrate-binding protein [Peptoniphilus stercorisuis]|uniref:Lipoprotein n=1 Tax=Peptoniphilus stercorisuis TaxID=1436965 RepID=A0ABS4KE72_9FIRM|nr:MetQ/NlpA family ABC transporter substrate-binding protein [Peptoniphilus stercorisuis]MBP2026057.1 D-methionine transport system substrate-binding protein [Peptoniphilus stercorisuis]
MKYFKKIILSITIVLSILSLMACSNHKQKPTSNSEDNNKIIIGLSPTPHKEIIENLKEDFKNENLDVEIILYENYVEPNLDLASGKIDANYFQHKPFFDIFSKEHNLDLKSLGSIHIEPIGIYSSKYSSLDDLKEFDTITIPNDSSNKSRSLRLLHNANIIKLKNPDFINLSNFDIEENTKNLDFVFKNPEDILKNFSDSEIIILNSNFALSNGIDPIKDSLFLEDIDSPYANIITIRKEDEENEKYQKFIQIIQSEKTKEFINKSYNGSVIATFK